MNREDFENVGVMMQTTNTMSEQQLWAQLGDGEARVLRDYRFDPPEFLALRAAYLSGELSASKNRLTGAVSAPRAQDVRALAERDTPAGREYIALGKAAIAAGEVGVVVLNGGMATRFGGVVKGCVEVFDGLSFLGLKALDVRRHGPNVRMLLMNSFATTHKTHEHLRAHNYFGLDPAQVIAFDQSISIRLTPQGDIFREAAQNAVENGERGENDTQNHAAASFYAPGHGDLQTALGRGALAEFQRGGGKYLLMSNVDNVLATLDPLVVGMHVDASARGLKMTVEAVQKKPGQVGGFVARVDGHAQIVEHFRLPDPALKDSLQLLNTNTFLFDVDALTSPAALTWFVVEKSVDGRTAIQFERLAGELSAVLPTTILQVPATGEESRFEPVKEREDLANSRAHIESLSRKRGIL